MIKNKDRSGWFGASDTNIIMSDWNTKTFAKWWLEKLGVLNNNYTNIYMLAGTFYEHRILDAIGVTTRDRQIRCCKYRIRVNLDGETADTIKEVKTYSQERFKANMGYWRQAQVQMYIVNHYRKWWQKLPFIKNLYQNKELEIVAYKLLPEDYKNFYNPIDESRLSFYQIEYDAGFIKKEYLPRVKYLAKCLKQRKTPVLSEVKYG